MEKERGDEAAHTRRPLVQRDHPRKVVVLFFGACEHTGEEWLVPQVHTDLPERRGERELAQKLMSLPDKRLHLWFGLDFLPGVRDIDVLIWHEDEGIFTVEVKAVPLNMIESFAFRTCTIRGRDSDISPQRQAYEAYESLREYLGQGFVKKMGYVSSTACWPLIYRRDWNRNFDNPKLCGEFAKRMIFREDLRGGASAFSERLRYIYRNPPYRGGARYSFVHKDANLQAFKQKLEPEARLKPADSDFQRLRRIEREVKAEALKDVPIDRQTRLVYYGYPGTGKTFRLLGIALQHSLAGRRVLLACYNKVLAADLRRLMSFSEDLKSARGTLEIRDMYELLVEFASQYGVKDIESDDANEWGELVADEMTESPDMRYYDTVLVDEAQDMEDWALRMLEHLGLPKATICVAAGKGQELYGTSSEWLKAFWRANQAKELRRNFRNTKPVFRLAQTFYETKLNRKKVATFLSKFKDPAQKETEVLFDREDGLPTMFYYINDSELDEYDPEDSAFDIVQQQVMVPHYRRIIKEQLDEMSEARGGEDLDEYPMDLLILVPIRGSQEHQWAVQALKTFPGGMEYIDYTHEDNRRRIARRDAVRLCTFHSARGIEGTRVVAFGFESVKGVAEKTNTDYPNLGYIALSRSVFEMLTVFRSSRRTWLVPTFIERVLKEMRAEKDAKPAGGAKVKTQPPPEVYRVSTLETGGESKSRETLQSYRVGDEVKHKRYDNGVVQRFEGSDGDKRMIVRFERFGFKSLRQEDLFWLKT